MPCHSRNKDKVKAVIIFSTLAIIGCIVASVVLFSICNFYKMIMHWVYDMQAFWTKAIMRPKCVMTFATSPVYFTHCISFDN